MGNTDMRIIFDKPEKTFLNGEMLTGWLVVKTKKRITLKSISVKIQGQARTLWNENGHRHNKYSLEPESEDLNDFKRRMDNSGIEKYFKKNIILFGEKEEEEDTLQPGERCFKFQMRLPTDIPPSFEGAYGQVRYKVKGKIVRPLLGDRSVEAIFRVISLVDLNTTPQIQYPLTINNHKHFLNNLSKSPPLSLVTKIDVKGFDMYLRVDVDNASDVDITAIKFEIQRRITYYSTHRTYFKCESSVVLIGQLPGSVPGYSSRTWTRKIKLTENTTPSFMKKCKIIDLNYRLKVRAKPSGVHLSLETDIPVIIGTKPITSNIQAHTVPDFAAELPTLPSENKETRSKWSTSRLERYF